jgi:NAD(P)-dependent dehydrogenase (short-subunit alcohol dehydrogenase family)/acyl carrier protein
VSLVETLRAEGWSTLSLGLTPGTQIGPHPGDDADVRRLLVELHDAGILDGDANFQFKSKFRPRIWPSFLCCAPGAGAAHLDEFLSLFGNPLHRDELEALVRARTPAKARPRRAGRAESDGAGEALHPLLQRRVDVALRSQVFAASLGLDHPAFLADHRIRGVTLFPATGWIEMAIAAAAQGVDGDVELADLEILEPLPLLAGVRRQVQVTLTPAASGDAEAFVLEIWNRPEEAPAGESRWSLNARGEIRRRPATASVAPAARSLPSLVEKGSPLDADALYAGLAQAGYEYGPSFRGVRHLLRIGERETLGRIELPESAPLEGYLLHPALVDAGLHAGMPLLAAGDGLFLPVGLERFRLYRRPAGHAWVHVRLVSEPGAALAKLALALLDDGGELLAECDGFLLKRVEDAALRRLLEPAAPGGLVEGFYELSWRLRPRPAAVAPETPENAHWLILGGGGGGGVGEALADLVAGQGQSASLVAAPESDPQGLDRLLDALDPAVPLRIVHLQGLDLPESASRLAAQRAAGAGILHLVQALAGGSRDAQLWLVTAGVQPFADKATESSAAQAMLWGLGRTLARELPQHWGGLIDLPQEDDPRRAAAILWEEIGRPGLLGKEPEIAFAGPRRLVPRLTPVRLSLPAQPPSFRATGTHLITGGLGALGLRVAEWLVERGARHLVLVARRPPEPDRAVEIARRLAGAEVKIRQADVALRQPLADLFVEIAASGAPLCGVVHAAGVLDDGILLNQSWERFEKVLAPKVEGAWNLHLLTRELDLDYFVLFSSITALLGSPGQGAYAAGNAFLDALAWARHRRGLPAVSVDWGPWAEAGMAAAVAAPQRRQWAAQGIGEIAPRDGLGALGAILASNLPQAGFFPLDVRRLGTGGIGLSRLFEELAAPRSVALAAAKPSIDRDRLLSEARETRREQLEVYLRERVAATLRLNPAALDPDQKINRLGMDSLMIMELRNRIRSDLSLDVPMAAFFNYPSVRQMVDLVLAKLAEEPAPPAVSPLPVIPAVAPSEVQVDQLSDEEVDALLRELTGGGEL